MASEAKSHPPNLIFHSPSAFLDAMEFGDMAPVDTGFSPFALSAEPQFANPFKHISGDGQEAFDPLFSAQHYSAFDLDNAWVNPGQLSRLETSTGDHLFSYDTGYGSNEGSPDKSPPSMAQMTDNVTEASSNNSTDVAQHPRRRNKASNTKTRASKQQESKEPARKVRRMSKTSSVDLFEAMPGDGEDKREQFLARNREAASKCRQKKKQWTSNLEERARILSDERQMLTTYLAMLKNELLMLKCKCLEHSDCGCESIREYLKSTVTNLPPADKTLYEPMNDKDVKDLSSDMSKRQASFDMGSSPGKSNAASPIATSDSSPGVDTDLISKDDEDRIADVTTSSRQSIEA